ncbi:MAG: methyltransferase domain-containing protein [Rhodospirillales bacterium]
MHDIYFVRTDCRGCGFENLRTVASLAPMAIATPNFDVPDNDRDHPVYRAGVPLELSLCDDCGLLQVLHIGNPEIQYPNYVYETNHSLGLVEHFRTYADDVAAEIGNVSGGKVIEIGSNDGTLLGFFKDRGMTPLGIDPAENIARKATDNGIPTIVAFFGEETAKRVLNEHGPGDLIIANNVIANVDDLNGFFAGVKVLLSESGRFVFETQYGADVIERLLLDTIYHEHLTYMNIRPIIALAERNGLKVVDVKRIDTKGGSIRVTVMHDNAGRQPAPVVAEMVAQEYENGHYGEDLYSGFRQRIEDVKTQLRELVAETRAAGKQVAGYGVSVGTCVLMPTFGLDQEIDYLFDDNPIRGDRFSGPGYDIPIHMGDELAKMAPGIVILFAWRYAKQIMEKNQGYIESHGKFVVPLPSLVIHS